MSRALPIVATLLALSGVPPAGAAGEPCDAACWRELAKARAATEAYRDVTAATADGFIGTDDCVSSTEGAEGISYDNPSRFDTVIDVRQPEGLRYFPESLGHAHRRLAAVVYAAVVVQDGVPYVGVAEPAPDNQPPVLFGRAFDGPLRGRTPAEPWRYELRVWLWADNPAGRFAHANPAEACGMGDVVDPDLTYRNCHEVNGVARVDETHLRRVTGLPDSYELVLSGDGGGRVLIGGVTCEVDAVAGPRTRSFLFVSPLVESPLGYRMDVCCSRYLWKLATDARDDAAAWRKGTNIGRNDVIYDPELAVTFAPLVIGAGPGYSMSVPSLGVRLEGTATTTLPTDSPIGLYFFRDVPQGTRQMHFRSDNLRLSAAKAAIHINDGSPLADLLGPGTTELRPAFTVAWEEGRIRLRTTRVHGGGCHVADPGAR